MNKVSIIIPVYNEEANVKDLFNEISTIGLEDYEIIFVNDGSTDNTLNRLKEIDGIKIVSLRKNYGQTASIQAGFDASTGDVIITMDGDLQNDPHDIPNLINKLNEGYDLVCGWRKNRKDPLIKKLISRGANRLRKVFLHDRVHDSGCTLRAYTKQVASSFNLYGELHRFIPALTEIEGYKVTEMVVNHRPRVKGVTKYNGRRIIKAMADLISVWFYRKFSNRPLHLFGGLGVILIFLGFILGLYLFIARILGVIILSDKIWPLIDVLILFTGVQLLVSGLIADIAIKGFKSTNKEKPYKIKEIIEK